MQEPYTPTSLVVNMFGAPCVGKSTLAAHLFSLLKQWRVDAELVTEVAKDYVYENGFRALKNQIYVFGNQHHRVWRVADRVDVVITDSPFLLSAVYDIQQRPYLRDAIAQEFLRYDNLNFVLEKFNTYSENGRYHSQDESDLIDQSIRDLLDSYDIPYHTIPSTNDRNKEVARIVKSHLIQREVMFLDPTVTPEEVVQANG